MAPRPSADLAASTAATKGERTRRRLLALAIDRFGEQGFRGTSVSEIARAAGITQASAYAYFDNKESLYMAAVDDDATRFVIAAHAAVADGRLVRDRFRAFLVALYEGLEDHPLTRRILSGAEADVLQRLVELPALRVATDLIIEDLRAGQLAGDVRRDVDITVLGAGIEGIILSLLIGAVQSNGVHVPRYEAGIFAAFDAMLAPPRPPPA